MILICCHTNVLKRSPKISSNHHISREGAVRCITYLLSRSKGSGRAEHSSENSGLHHLVLGLDICFDWSNKVVKSPVFGYPWLRASFFRSDLLLKYLVGEIPMGEGYYDPIIIEKDESIMIQLSHVIDINFLSNQNARWCLYEKKWARSNRSVNFFIKAQVVGSSSSDTFHLETGRAHIIIEGQSN